MKKYLVRKVAKDGEDTPVDAKKFDALLKKMVATPPILNSQIRVGKPKIYKTGDRHPTLNLLAFVEYEPEANRPIWTSVAGDEEAPYRLAKENERLRLAGTPRRIHKVGTEYLKELQRRMKSDDLIGSSMCGSE